jgi:hypothetical protein
MATMRAPLPGDPAGTFVADLLAPATYVVRAQNRSDVQPVTVQVGEGADSEATLTVP